VAVVGASPNTPVIEEARIAGVEGIPRAGVGCRLRAVETAVGLLAIPPAGSRHPIDYSAPAGPTVEVRAQALFGLAQHPAIANGQVPLTLAITSPAGRPIQTTKDLPGFWTGSWRDVAKDMRGRYPKHAWPDDPASAAPTLKTKRAS